MRVFVTGAAGFVMGAVARELRARGDAVVALVRDPDRAVRLRELGCELVVGDLAAQAALERGLSGAAAAIHGAAIYEVGISRARRSALFESNVRGTERVLSAALAARVPKVVYVSSVVVLGDTHGKIVDEAYRRDPGYTSYYDETKHRAHEIALRFIERGLPCVIVQPGQVYGPGDHSGIGGVLHDASRGRLPAIVFADLGLDFVHVDDVADGILLALDRGRVGESFVLGGENATVRDALRTLARVTGHRAPRIEIPAAPLRALAPFSSRLREILSSADGVTFWARDDKARQELGYAPRDLETGLRQTYH
ncbi:MAG: NAD-dependent epimerase/dehydratase family protein [Chloroflexi bacterium]|nr:NAD-dependent epimerase/dehydratase family protein [Chloroflexota bacterium]